MQGRGLTTQIDLNHLKFQKISPIHSLVKKQAPANSDPALAAWLRQQGIALALSTYRANRLIFLGVNANGALRIHERLYDRPMGLFASGQSLWMAGRSHLWRFDNLLVPGQHHDGADRLYVPAASFLTGEVNAHELVLTSEEAPLFVNTVFSCLAQLTPGCSFQPVWQPPFIDALKPEDRCHLNGVAVEEGVITWATACSSGNTATSWRNSRQEGGVVVHIPTGAIAASGLTMPHSPRWHKGKLWLLNSGTGELGWIEQERFQPLCALPGFVRGLAFAGGCAVVGLSKLRSPQFTGLPLEERLQGGADPQGCCGIRVIDLASGDVLHRLDLPKPIDELFDVTVLEQCQQPQALGLLDDAIDFLVKLPQQDSLVRIRPSMPSGTPHQGPAVERLGLPHPATAKPIAAESCAASPADNSPIHYQRVFQLTEATLAPYADLTFPSLTPGSASWRTIQGELLGISASDNGTLVALALAECKPDKTARLISLFVSPRRRRQGIATRLITHLSKFLQQQGLINLSVNYQAPQDQPGPMDRLLPRLGWSTPQQIYRLMKGEADKLAAIPWPERFPLPEGYRLVPWRSEYAATALERRTGDNLTGAMQSSQLEPQISLALLHHNTLVGWVLVDRTCANATRISSVFVDKGHRTRGQALTLLVHTFRKQHAVGIPIVRAAVPPHSQAMLRLVDRHLGQHFKTVTSARSSQRNLESDRVQRQ